MDLLSQWSDKEYWRQLCPRLTISDDNTSTASDNGYTEHKPQLTDKQLQRRLVQDGYALIDVQCNNNLRNRVAQAISDIESRHSLPATFALLFDETWQLAFQSQQFLLSQNKILHPGMKFNFDMLAWHIDPTRNQVGFSPHRDRQPDTSDALQQSFYADGQAKYVTHWISLTDANPNNSCLYVIPKQFDPGYLQGDDGDDPPKENNDSHAKESKDSKNEDTFSDPLSRALPTKQSYQNIRALPRQPGQSIIFTHRILHWGSAGNPHYSVGPRIAISFVYSDPEYEAPYLNNYAMIKEDNVPPFTWRLLLVCAQLLIYYQRFELSSVYLRACYDYVKLHEMELNEMYRKKVFVEFVKAMKKCRDGGAVKDDDTSLKDNGDVGEKNRDDDNNGDSDDEDAMLEAMLDNQEEFDDDFDNLEYTCETAGERKRAKVNT